MPELRTRSAGAKVTDKEYAEIEKLAQTRGLNVGEWCREVILAAVTGAEAAPKDKCGCRTLRFSGCGF